MRGLDLNKHVTYTRLSGLISSALWFCIGLGVGVAVAADCRVAIVIGVIATGTALWVGTQ